MGGVMEEWLPIGGHEGFYEVSNLGRVRSLERRVWVESRNTHYRIGPRILRLSPNSKGYATVGLHREGERINAKVHRLVADAWLGAPEAGQEVCHNNGDPLDNRVENLRWDSRSANTYDSVRHGSHPQASRSQCAAGHPYVVGSFSLYRNARICRSCSRAAEARYQARRAAAA